MAVGSAEQGEYSMKSTIILDPHPRTVDLLFSKAELRRLRSLGKVVSHDGERMPDAEVDRLLPDAIAIVGQTTLLRERLNRAPKLRAIINVEGNFQPNIDYAGCLERGIYVLNAGVAYSYAVAEMAVGFALAMARGIPQADRRFREGKEVYGRISNEESFLLRRKRVGLIGYGSLGRALAPLLRPFGCELYAYDPWLPDGYLVEQGLSPLPLRELLASCTVIYVLAGATTDNRAMLGREELNLIKKDSIFVLLSRASVVDFDALTAHLKTGRFRAAIDVFPEEPFARNHSIRTLDNVLLSAHRAGGLAESYQLMGEMVIDDLALICKGLSPVRLQRANRETAPKMQSKPVTR